MAAYASASDLLKRSDPNTVAALCGDDVGGTVSQVDLEDDTNLAAALEDASGQVEAAALVGQRYSVTDLTGLTGNSSALLKRIVCTIAMALLLERRPIVHFEGAEKYLERAEQYLDNLRAGKRIFNVEDNVGKQTPTIGGPTSAEYTRENLLPDRMTRHFPSRADRLPTDRG